jgi:hypothetical protein
MAAIKKNNRAALNLFIMLILSYASLYEFCVESQVKLLRLGAGDIAQASPKKASRIFLVAGNIALICATRMVTKLLRTQCGEYFPIVTDQRSATSHYQPQLHTQGLGAGVGRGRGVILGRGVGPC